MKYLKYLSESHHNDYYQQLTKIEYESSIFSDAFNYKKEITFFNQKELDFIKDLSDRYNGWDIICMNKVGIIIIDKSIFKDKEKEIYYKNVAIDTIKAYKRAMGDDIFEISFSIMNDKIYDIHILKEYDEWYYATVDVGEKEMHFKCDQLEGLSKLVENLYHGKITF